MFGPAPSHPVGGGFRTGGAEATPSQGGEHVYDRTCADACAGRRRRSGPGRAASRESGNPAARRDAGRRRPGGGGGDRPVHDRHGREPAVGLSRARRGGHHAARGARAFPRTDLRVERPPRRVRRRDRGGPGPRRGGGGRGRGGPGRSGAWPGRRRHPPDVGRARHPTPHGGTRAVGCARSGGRSRSGPSAVHPVEPAGPGDRPARRRAGVRRAPQLPCCAAQASPGRERRPARAVAERGAVGIHRPGRRRAQNPPPGRSRGGPSGVRVVR